MIHRLCPFEDYEFPDTLLPNPRCPVLPPLFIYGWLIDDKRFLDLAIRRQMVVWGTEEEYPDDWDEHEDPSTIKVVPWLNEVDTFEFFSHGIVRDTGVKLPLSNYVKEAYGPGCEFRAVFGLYDNYHTKQKPSNADIAKLKEACEFTHEPQWFPQYIGFYWRDKKHLRPF